MAANQVAIPQELLCQSLGISNHKIALCLVCAQWATDPAAVMVIPMQQPMRVGSGRWYVTLTGSAIALHYLLLTIHSPDAERPSPELIESEDFVWS